MGKKEWNEAATAIARAVVGVMPTMNEDRIRSRCYTFFASEDEYSSSIYNDNNYYYTADVTEILDKAFLGEPDDEQQMVVNSDFRWAFDQLSDAYRYRILERYQHSVTRPADSPERAQLNRAIRKLAEILNTWNRNYQYEGTGAREVWSNARSAKEIRDNNSGGSSITDPFGTVY